MDNSYLWDKSGAPDAFTVKLETALVAKRAKVKAVGLRRKQWTLRLVGGTSCLVAAAAALVLWMGSGETNVVVPQVLSPKSPAVAVETDTPPAGTELPANEVTDPDEDPKTKKARGLSEVEKTGLGVSAESEAPTTSR